MGVEKHASVEKICWGREDWVRGYVYCTYTNKGVDMHAYYYVVNNMEVIEQNVIKIQQN